MEPAWELSRRLAPLLMVQIPRTDARNLPDRDERVNFAMPVFALVFALSLLSAMLSAMPVFALLAAYVFRMQAYDAEQAKLLEEYDRAAKQDPPDLHTLERQSFRGNRQFSEVEHLARSMGRSLWWTGATIGLCLLFMPLTNPYIFSAAPWVPWLFLVGTVASAFHCLWLYYPLVKNVVNPLGHK